MKYKWGGLLETLEETDGKHENPKLTQIQKIIEAVEETKDISSAKSITTLLKQHQDYLCSPLLDDLFEGDFKFTYAIKKNNLEMCKFLEERKDFPHLYISDCDILQYLGRADIEILEFFFKKNFGRNSIHILSSAIQTGELERVKFVCSYMDLPLQMFPYSPLMGKFPKIVEYILSILKPGLQLKFILNYVYDQCSFICPKTLQIFEKITPLDGTEILMKHAFFYDNVELVDVIKDKIRSFPSILAYGYKAENCIRFLMKSGHITREMLKRRYCEIYLEEATAEEVMELLRDNHSEECIIKKCIEMGLTNTDEFYKYLGAGRLTGIEFMLFNKPDLVDIDRLLKSIPRGTIARLH